MTADPLTGALMEKSAAFMAAAERTTHLLSLNDGTVEILTILHALQEGAGDDEPELVARLQEVENFLSEKLEACSVVVRDLESLAAYRKAEADRLRDQAKRLEASADRLRLRIRDHMLAVGDDKIVTPRFTLSLRQNPYRVDVLEPAMVPHEYNRTKITVEVDKRAILEEFKRTGEIPAGVSIERTTRVDIS